MAKATQRHRQSKEQTKIIAQGIEKGIDQYKKQQKAKAREKDKQRKKEEHQTTTESAEQNPAKSCKIRDPLSNPTATLGAATVNLGWNRSLYTELGPGGLNESMAARFMLGLGSTFEFSRPAAVLVQV